MRMLKVTVIPMANGARLPARPATAVLSTTVTRKKASTASIIKPAAGVMVSAIPPRARLCASAGVPRPEAAPRKNSQQKRAGDTSDELTDHIANGFGRIHGARGEDPNGHGGIDMSARDGTVGEGEGHNGQAMGQRDRGNAGKADALADHGRSARTDEHE